MRAAIHLHLFYPDLAVALVERVAALGRADIDVFATHVGPLDRQVDAALDRIPGRVERIAVANAGWDLGPLFHLLPQLADEGHDVVAHLHTKRGDSGYAAEWRAIGLDGTIGSGTIGSGAIGSGGGGDATITAVLAAFAADPALMLAGPAALYKSAAAHRFGNADRLAALAPRLMAPSYPPADWGFFAGSFFWARPALLARVAALVDFAGADFAGHEGDDGDGDDGDDGGGAGARDGTDAHALERLIGLAPVAAGGAIGLVGDGSAKDGSAKDGLVETFRAPGRPDDVPVIRTLVARAERMGGPPDPATAALAARHNPLLHHIRHWHEADAPDPNPYFSTGWYGRVHADVFAAAMDPLHHYIHHGAAEGRATGPLFDGRHYRRAYPDVTGDPLRHFLAVGVGRGRVAIPVSTPDHGDEDARPRRFYRRFDIEREAAFLAAMAALPDDVAARAAATRVSIVMPAWNREATIAAAIRSVLAQTHRAWELIVVDDGSTDATRDIVAGFLDDPRVRLVAGAHGGVSAARNLGLDHAGGDLVAYLDSDNRWTAWFLAVMVRFMARRGLEAPGFEAAYAGIALRDDLGHLTGYRGDDFDWDACLAQNYVDLNGFVHARRLIDTVGRFDANLRRMVDWDMILRIGRGRAIGYAPFVGCDYFDGRADDARITVGEPSAYQTLVRTKHVTGLATGTAAFAAAVRLSFAIKIAAPEEEKDAWGDYHFAEALAAAIRRLGHEVHVDFRGRWAGRPTTREDVAIVLRGLLPYEPRPGQLALMWNISHPDQVPFEEYDRFARVYVASDSHAALLAHIVRPPVAPLLQATDFRPADAVGPGPDVLFVGNSRGVKREIVAWAIAAGRPPEIHGGGWDGLVPDELVRSANVANADLPALYAGAGVVLNDHWPSMRAHGYLSNRLFDVVASGGRAVSDPVPSMAAVFGDAVAQVDGPAALGRAVDMVIQSPVDTDARIAFAERHGFDRRAETIVGDVFAMLGLARPEPLGGGVGVGSLDICDVRGEAPLPPVKGRGAGSPTALRVHAIVPHGPHGPQSSAFIRLVAPLTDDGVAGRVVLSLGRAGDPPPDCDVCIVQRTALPDMAAVDALVGRLGEMGAALVTDVDDAFAAIGDDHPEAAHYRPLAAALDRAIAASAETWFSTAPLAALYGRVAGRRFVLPNAIDPRLWRDWRHPRPPILGDGPLRMLCMGTHTHGADFALVRPQLDALWAARPGAFAVTVVGVAPDLAPAPWLARLSPPAGAVAYPRFVRWLAGQGPFDIGLAPLADTGFNRAKSDIKLLDYAALGLLPVVSAGPAYAADPVAGRVTVAGAGAGAGEGDWHGALAAIMDDRPAARALAARGVAHLWAKRTVAGIAPAMVERLEAYRR